MRFTREGSEVWWRRQQYIPITQAVFGVLGSMMDGALGPKEYLKDILGQT